MTRKLILDAGEHDGIVEEFHFDEGEQKVHINRVADIQPVLEANVRAFNDNSHRPKTAWMAKVGEIPLVLVEKLGRARGVDYMAKGNEDLLLGLLNDPDYLKLKTAPGRV